MNIASRILNHQFIPPVFPATEDNFIFNDTTAQVGYVYYQYHSEESCGGYITYLTGIRSNICFLDISQGVYYMMVFTAGKYQGISLALPMT